MTDKEAVLAILRDSFLGLGDLEWERELDEKTATEARHATLRDVCGVEG